MNSQANLQLKKFDLTSIADDKVVVLIGKRETGKSFLVKDLLHLRNQTLHFENLPILF